MKTFFTSDQHFGHSKIIEYCNRPYKSVHEMNNCLVANHNKVVGKEDTVYHLGDFAFRDHKNFLSQLNGKHYLIKGNHEGKDWRDAGFIWVKDVAMVRVGDQDIFLSHYAHRTWNRAHHGVFHAYGHDHGNCPDHGRSCDVGVDAWGYMPVQFEQLVERFKDVPSMRHH